MARMSDLALEVEEWLRGGATIEEVVDALGIPEEWVLEVHNMMDWSEE